MSDQLPFDYQSESTASLPETIQGYVSIRSQGGKAPFSLKALPSTAEPFYATKKDVEQATKAVESMGLKVVTQSRLGLAISGPGGAFEELTGGKLVATELLLWAEGSRQRYVTHIDIVGDNQPAACGCGIAASEAAHLDGVLIERPRQPAGISPSPLPPSVASYHLRVPDDVAVGLGAHAAHRSGYFGEGVKVAMVDSGHYAHPFFAAHSYDVQPAKTVVAGTDTSEDPLGHGTGESANVFAVAPAAQLRPYRASNKQGRLVGGMAGFLAAKAERPHVLTNSWGGDGQFPPPAGAPIDAFDTTWALEIIDAVQQGIFVVFSAGNGSFSIEPQIAEVMSAGGVYMENDIDLRASNYTSGYESPYTKGRIVPDACGLVGLQPRGAYLMLPVPAGVPYDVDRSHPALHDAGDGTTETDGWALFSGTSAAAPQLAGVAALILSARPGLSPAKVKQAMLESAIDVRAGSCHPRFNNPAAVGRDLATGYGLVNAARAVKFALKMP